MASFVDNYLGTFVRPSQVLRDASDDGAVRRGASALLVGALIYALFALWLYLAGHQPSFTGNPIPAEQYYLWQAAFLPPWLLLAWAASASAAHGVSRLLGSEASWRQTAAPMGFALGVPLAWSYVAPEMVVFGVFGHDALVSAMRVTGPVTLVWWAVLVWKALRATHDYSRAACGATVVVALLVFGAVTAVLVR